ncbi:BrnA antitoxin family protein [Methylobacterium symbioticum]|uniref:BrnA antitoxin family protein n=1 Tax=Methylobacterium symbioticum TaxID=2584084 RepID=A0A509EGF1_9HYPH|nr:BrnA antitoxin family protein [Methylobacterium symbioticum]VUD72263.1 hypothetical protein MET9862_02858 [Methylobacterium symbioticum]
MSANRSATPPISADLIGATDLARVDAHVIQPEEYEEIPELTDEMLAGGEPGNGAGIARRRGRPRSDQRKVLTALRLDPDVIAAFKATGPGWQTRINDILKRESERLRRAG